MDSISVPTITLCIFIVMVALAVAMAIIWHHNRSETAAALWAPAFLAGACSGLTITLLPHAPEIGVIVASVLNTLSYTLSWSAYRAFGSRKVYPSAIVGLPAAMLLVHLLFPALRENPNNAVMLQSTLTCIFATANAFTVYGGKGNSELSLTKPLVGFLLMHAAFHGANVLVLYNDPAPLVAGRIASTWFKLFMLEAFLNVTMIATSSMLLIKERSEQRHRIASETDMLTGVANRRAFVHRTDMALKSAGEGAVLAIIDLDHFKSINDEFGHQAGDRTLVEFARTIRDHLPHDILFGRIGGEEFAVFIPDDPKRSAFTLLDEMREAVEKASIQSQGRPLRLTVSIGAATIAKAGTNFDNLVAAADCALYAAKEEGRNRVTLFSPTMRLLKVLEHDGEKRIGLAEQRISRRVTRVYSTRKTAP